MNRLVSIFRKVIVCCMLLGAAWAAQAQAFSGSGSGTTADPYIINDAAQLDEVRNDLAAHYRLGSDIDLTAYLASGGAGYAKWGASGWLPIGANFTTRFAGSFNGAGYKISGLTIARSGTDYVGLFGYTGGASIDSLGIENCNIAGNNRVGGLAGHNGAAASGGSTFSNCYVTGIVTGGGSNVGGLIGDNDNNSVVSNCYAAATVNGGGSSSSVGGLVGVNNASTISNCYATGTVTGGNNYIGGLVGQNPNLSTISNCYATGTVNGGNNYVGGLAGGNGGGSGSSTISNCYATGTVRGGNNYIGGLVGSNYNSSPTIKNCVAANDSVIATGSPTYINRIVGNTGTLINNYANEDMVVMENGSPYDISANIGLSDLAGANANMASLKTLAFYNTAGNWNTQEWDIDNVDNSAKIWQICEGENLPFLQWQEDIACTPPPTVVGNNSIVFVNKTVVGGDGSGSSWANAAPELADALQAAKFYAGTPNSISEIWVAASTYLPLYTAVEGATGDDGRNNAFVLIKDLAVYGGFPQNANDTDNAPSLTSPLSTLTLEQARNTRDWNANPTVLSGERGNPNSLTDNCFHVVVAVNITRNSVLDGFTVTKGYANAAIGSFYVVDGQQIDRRNGGGIYTKNASSLTLCNLVVDSNRAVNWGGGIYNDTNSAPLIKNSILMRNQALYGGGIYNMMGAVVMTDLVIKSNYVSFGGSGIDNNQASAVVNNTLILNNTANNIGGGVHNQGAAPKFTNVLIAKNHAGQGGGMYSSTTSRPVLTNVTMSGNYAAVAGTATYAGGGGFYNTGSSRPAVNNCIVWGNYEGTNTPSEVLNAAGTSYLNPSYSLIGGGTLSGGIILNGDPLFVDTAAGDYQLQVGSPAKNEGDTNLYKTARGIADFTNEPDLAGNPRLFDGNIDLGAYENPTLTPLVFTPDANGIVYVDETKNGDGSSWADAYPNLADPLIFVAKQQSGAVAVDASDTIRAIYVAEGNYYPMYTAYGYHFTNKVFPQTDDGRNNAFVLVQNIKIYGGFVPNNIPVGISIPDFGTTGRDGITVLSGDLDKDDIPGNLTANKTDNCFRVLVGMDIPASSDVVIDGFTISGGYADQYSSLSSESYINNKTINRHSGGGIYSDNFSAAIANVTIKENSAYYGGGVYHLTHGLLTFFNATISENSAFYDGGGIYNNTASAVFTNVVISGNTANLHNGGGIHNAASSPILTNVVISGNIAAEGGGGVYNSNNCSPIFTNVTISGNYAGTTGGGMLNITSDNDTWPNLLNCIIWGNEATTGNNVYNDDSKGKEDLINLPIYNHSLVEDVNAPGIISNADPLFVDAKSASAAPTIEGDYSLLMCSPAVNAGDTNLYKTARGIADFTGETDLAGDVRLFDGNIDLGAYEYPLETILVVWGNTTLTYDGSLQAPTATAVNNLGQNLPLTITGEQTSVGGPYTATATLTTPNGNYVLCNTTALFNIALTPETIAVVWSNTTLTYNGSPQAPTATAVNNLGQSVPLNVSGGQTNAGSGYTAAATLADPSGNYVLTNTTAMFSIAPETVPVAWGDTTLTYNGNPQIPTATATGVLNENLLLTVVWQQTNAGSGYTAEATLSTTNSNYILSNETTTFSIEPETVPVVWGNTTLIYNGSPQAPTATATGVLGEDLPLSVSGAQTNAGSGYTATAMLYPTNGNYILSGAETTFEIVLCDTVRFEWQGGNACFNINATNGEDFNVAWGDGTDENQTGTGTIQSVNYFYSDGEDYTVTVSGTIDCEFTALFLAYMQVEVLDLSAAYNLKILYCENNQINTIVLPPNPLTFIQCFNNSLQLSDLFAISETISNATNKRLGTQNLPNLSATVGEELFDAQSVFNGIFTDYEVENATQGTEFTVTDGKITFIQSGTYTVTMTNSAIVSNPTYPAKVVVQLEVGE